jgi:UDP-N-acetylglucosamine transferase subunit ALG13
VEIVHQTGHAMCDVVRAKYEELGVPATVTPFIDDMAKAYASAALVIGRAGASSLAGICAVGRPSILVPFPAAADDHQWHNAQALASRGAAVAIREADLTAELLANHVGRLLSQPEVRRQMADAARSMGKPDAAAAIVDDLLGWLGGSSGEVGDSEGGEGESDPPVQGSDSQVRRFSTFPPAHGDRSARRRCVRKSLAWSQVDRYYGTRAVTAVE